MSLLDAAASLTPAQAEQLAGPFFGASLFPYLAFLYFLNAPQSSTPRGVVVGFAWCLIFVFGTIPGAIAAKLQFGVSLSDCDWLHGSAESLLTVTNLLIVLAFRDALATWQPATGAEQPSTPPRPQRYGPWAALGLGLSALSFLSCLAPALASADVHAPFLGGLLDLPRDATPLLSSEPPNALSIPCWLVHTSSLVEWLVAMGLAWRWAETTSNPTYKGLTWAMLPLHTSGITACVYALSRRASSSHCTALFATHRVPAFTTRTPRRLFSPHALRRRFHLFYNSPGVCALLPTQAAMTCVGNTCCAFAAYRIAAAGGWTWQSAVPQWAGGQGDAASATERPDGVAPCPSGAPLLATAAQAGKAPSEQAAHAITRSPERARADAVTAALSARGSMQLRGDEPRGLSRGSGDLVADFGDQYGFLAKLFGGCLVGCFALKYGELLEMDFFASGPIGPAVACIAVPTALNTFKWSRRSRDPEFDGWF